VKLVFSVNGVPIRLSVERREHIENHHPETTNQEKEILETINSPDCVQKGDAGTLLAVKRYGKTPVSENKYLVVAYKETSDIDGFVLIAYYQSDLRKRVIIWKK